MNLSDIMPDTVLAAVLNGEDNLFKLADWFGVPYTDHELQLTIAQLLETDRLIIASTSADDYVVIYAVADV
jgi:hypothetical protein